MSFGYSEASPALKKAMDEHTLFHDWRWEPLADGSVRVKEPIHDLFHGPQSRTLIIGVAELNEAAGTIAADEYIYGRGPKPATW